MDSTVEFPAEPHPAKFRFNKENARMFSLKSWEARRSAQASSVATPAQSEPASDKQLEQKDNARAIVIDALIGQTITKFSKTRDPREMQALAMALDRLYGTWALLTGHERPGVRRSAADRVPGRRPGRDC